MSSQLMNFLEEHLPYQDSQGETHIDAQSIFFVVQALEHVRAQVYEQLRSPLTARTMFGVIYDGDTADTTYTYEIYDGYGVAEVIANYGDDIPSVDISGRKETTPIVPYAVSYGYNIQEMRAAAKTGKPLAQLRANMARRAFDERINKTVYNGHPEVGIRGVADQPNVGRYVGQASGAGGSTRWRDKNSQQKLQDLYDLTNAISIITEGQMRAVRVGMPVSLYNDAMTTSYSSQDARSIASVFRQNTIRTDLPGGIEIVECPELAGLGTGGTDMMVAAPLGEEHGGIVITQEFEQFPPQDRNLKVVINCHGRTAGLVIFQFLHYAFGEGY